MPSRSSFPARSCGARAFRWHWRRWRNPDRIPAGSSEAVRSQHRGRDRGLARRQPDRGSRRSAPSTRSSCSIAFSVRVGARAPDAARGEPASAKRVRTAAIALVIAAASARGSPRGACHRIPGSLVAYGRYSATWVDVGDDLVRRRGLNAFVAVSRGADRRPELSRRRQGAGVERRGRTCGCSACWATSRTSCRRVRERAGDWPRRGRHRRRRVDRARRRADDDRGDRSARPPRVSRYFEDHNYHVVDNPKVALHIDDARHLLLTTTRRSTRSRRTWSIPGSRASPTLFTREFFELVKRRLNPGGVVTQFVQLYESNSEAVKSEIATFVEVFPNTIVWGNPNEGQGYDLVLTGQVEPVTDRHRPMAGQARQPALRRGRAIAARDRHRLGGRAACQLCRVGRGPRAVAARRHDQSRPQPAIAVSGGHGHEPVPQRLDLFRDAATREVPRASVHRDRRRPFRR